MTITPQACRAARALLGWSMRKLAGESAVSLGAVNRLEGGEATPRRGTAKKVTDAFLTHGVQIVDEAAYTGAVMVYPRRDA
jgi:transcriptional regulator with XRE-family HTH domain